MAAPHADATAASHADATAAQPEPPPHSACASSVIPSATSGGGGERIATTTKVDATLGTTERHEAHDRSSMHDTTHDSITEKHEDTKRARKLRFDDKAPTQHEVPRTEPGSRGGANFRRTPNGDRQERNRLRECLGQIEERLDKLKQNKQKMSCSYFSV